MPKLSDTAALGLAAIVVATVLLHLAIPLPSDVSWLISVNSRLLDGRHLYAEILETNPPMAVWLYALPAALERLTGIAAESWTILETIAGALLALWLGACIVGTETLRLPLAVSAGVLLLLPVDSFAQREHFVLFGLLPWLALAWRRYESQPFQRWAPVVAAAGLALALAIKPHFALVVLAVALLVCSRRRDWRLLFALEHWIAGGLLVLYGLVVVIAYPAFIDNILPAASLLYVPLRMAADLLLLEPHALLIYFVLLASVLYRRQIGGGLPVVLVAIAACFVVYVIQGKGWSYHLLPGTALAALAFLELALRAPAPRWHIAVPAGFLVVLAVPPTLLVFGALARPEPLLALARYGRGQTLLFITSDIGLGNPVSRQLGDTIVNSSPMLWRATGALALQHTARAADASMLDGYMQQDYALLAHDLSSAPDTVLAETEGFDWLAWARHDPAVAALLKDYRPDGVIATHGTEVTVLRRR
jgi:hypothetical protein